MRALHGDSRFHALTRWTLAALGVWLILVVTTRDATAQFTQVTASLASKSFDKTLPFDEEFKIVGTATAPIKVMQVFYSLSSDEPPSCPYIEGPIGKWHGPYEYRNPAGSTSFDVHIEDPLEAEKTYTFKFCSTSAADPGVVTTFRGQAVDLLDRAIAGMSVKVIGDVEARSLRNQLCDKLKASLESDQILAVGSLFDCSTEDPQRLETFRLRLSDVLLPQFNLQLVFRADNYTNALTDLAASLATLAALPELDTLAAAMRDSGHARTPEVAAIADLTPAAAREMAEGRGPAVPVSAAALARTVASVAADVARNFNETEARLRNLYLFLNDNLRNEAVTEEFQATLSKPLPAATVTALRALAPAAVPNPPCPAAPLLCAVGNVTTLTEAHNRAAKLLPERAAALQEVSKFIALEIIGVSVIRATTFAAIDTNKTNYVSAEAGFLGMPRQREAATYIGTNIYFRPINQHAPLSRFGSIGRRVAMTVGLTVTSIADEEQTRFNLFGDQSLVLGLGVRVTEVLRLSAGTVVFRKADENPFVDRKSYAFEPYVAFSVDLNMALGAKGFGELFKPKGGNPQ
jgi:hypothetical protein